MTVIVAKWTIDEYHRMIDAGILSDRKVELLKGEIVEMSPEGEPHAYKCIFNFTRCIITILKIFYAETRFYSHLYNVFS